MLVAEITPPQTADAAPLREVARRFLGKVHALGISDNRDRVSMSALAAASLVAAEGIEPILHVNTRDRNRIALVSEALGARALGIRNLLCTSGSHQTLGRFRTAKNVYDIDSIQLLQTCAQLGRDGGASCLEWMGGDGGAKGDSGAKRDIPFLAETTIATVPGDGFCLGAVASPDADPLPWQVSRLVKKVMAGTTFLITQPVFDLVRFGTWWKEVTRHGIHEKVAILAGIQPLGSEQLAAATDGKRRPSRIPEGLIDRVTKGAPGTQHSAAVRIALETMETLSRHDGVRGFSICADGDCNMALEIIEKSGLGSP